MDLYKQLLLQFILIALNAFFASSEIAVESLNEKKLKARAEDGDKKAARMLKLVEDPTQFLSTVQIGITLAGFLGAAFAADHFADRLSSLAAAAFRLPQPQVKTIEILSVVLVTLILSFFTLVLGELVPKRVAMKYKDKLAESACGVISCLSAILKPVIWLLTISTNGVIRLFGMDPNEKEESVSEEDIVSMLDAGADEGSLDENDIEYIKNVFKLDGMTAQDVMTPRKALTLISSDATLEEVWDVIEKEGYSRIPIYTETIDNITGVLYSRDFLLHHRKPDFTLERAMFEPTFVPETVHLDTLFQDMQREHNHIVIVVNEYGETSGVVTIEDILEELVGEIWDESDEAVEDFTQLTESSWRVLASAGIDSFFSEFDLTPEEDTESSTVNGWLSEQLGDIPAVGDSFEYANLKITVTKADDVMAQEITVEVLSAEEENPSHQ
ncbi:MAG: HlyC/CorC family transporter [Clostridia bacterium]|nr:HlyC/CorC family transporter [Clostridia bacterium]